MTILLDASAVLAFLFDEPGAQLVENELGEGLVLSVNWSEVLQKVDQHGGDAGQVATGLLGAGIEVEPLRRQIAEDAAGMWSRYRSLSLADRCCLAAGERLEITVMTADSAWAALDLPVEVRLVR